MNNTWIVVPVTSNGVDLTSFVDKFSGGYVAPETYEKKTFNQETRELETENVAHPYAGQTGPDFTDKIVFVNMVDGYAEHSGVVHLESFGEINVPRLMNAGINHAVANGADNVVVLSNPCDFDPFTISEAVADIAGKNIVNIADGAAFVLPGDSSLRLNEDLKVWFWAEDLYRTAGDPVGFCRPEFIAFSELIPLHVTTPELEAITKEDEVKYNAKW